MIVGLGASERVNGRRERRGWLKAHSHLPCRAHAALQPCRCTPGHCTAPKSRDGLFCILARGHECLYNLQHKDYDNNLVKDSCWKEIAGEVHAQGKEQATQYFVHYRKAYCWCAFVWNYSDNVTALFILVEEYKSTWARLRSYWPNIFLVLSVLFSYTHRYFTSISTGRAKCCDVRELW